MIHADTVWVALKTLEAKGLIRRRKRKNKGSYNHNEYDLLIPAKRGIKSEKSPLESGHPKTPQKHGFDRPKKRGYKDHQRKDSSNQGESRVESRKQPLHHDFNSEPSGSASWFDDVALPTEEGAIKYAEAYYQSLRRNPDSPLGILRPREVRAFTIKWLKDAVSSGGYYKGDRIRMPFKALESYLDSCAENQSKRCKELQEGD